MLQEKDECFNCRIGQVGETDILREISQDSLRTFIENVGIEFANTFCLLISQIVDVKCRDVEMTRPDIDAQRIEMLNL